jgi:hypothetical protein
LVKLVFAYQRILEVNTSKQFTSSRDCIQKAQHSYADKGYSFPEFDGRIRVKESLLNVVPEVEGLTWVSQCTTVT